MRHKHSDGDLSGAQRFVLMYPKERRYRSNENGENLYGNDERSSSLPSKDRLLLYIIASARPKPKRDFNPSSVYKDLQ